MSIALSNKFAGIYCDEINIYYDGKLTPRTNQSIYAIIKEKFLKGVIQHKEFAKWIYTNFPALDEEQSIAEWEQSLLDNAQSNILVQNIVMMNKPDSITFYRKGTQNNELVELCSTSDDNFLRILHKYLSWGLRSPFYLKTDVRAVKVELTKALEQNIIPQINNVANFSNDPNIYCMAYMNLDELPEGDTPAWDNFNRTFTHDVYKELFMAWVYSIFKADNYGRQLLWIHGMGKSGKSTVVRTIYKYLQSINPILAQTIEHYSHEDKFSLASYKNTRLGIICDNADRWIIKRPTIKNLTGGDIVTIREMHKEKISQIIYCKVVIASNYPPFILIELEHEKSRMLYLQMDDKKIYESWNLWERDVLGDWDKALERELLYFLNKCKPMYEKHISKDGHNFIIPDVMIDDLAKNAPSMKETVDIYWDTHWIKDENAGFTSTNDIIDDFKRFMNGFTNNITKHRSYIYSKIRSLQQEITNLGVGRVQVIKGWREVEPKTTFLEMIDDKVKELNRNFKNKQNELS